MYLKGHGLDVDEMYLSRLFVRSGVTLKKIKHKQVGFLLSLFQKNKFTASNVGYYLEYVQAVREIDRNKLKYCDESQKTLRPMWATWSTCRPSVKSTGTNSNTAMSHIFPLEVQFAAEWF